MRVSVYVSVCVVAVFLVLRSVHDCLRHLQFDSFTCVFHYTSVS